MRADLLTSGPVRLSLAGTDGPGSRSASSRRPIDGHFEVFFEIPTRPAGGPLDTARGGGRRAIASTTIEVAGTPVGEEVRRPGASRRGRPAAGPVAVGMAGLALDPPARHDSPPRGRADGSIDPVPFVSLGSAVVALACWSLRTRPRRASGGADPTLSVTPGTEPVPKGGATTHRTAR